MKTLLFPCPTTKPPTSARTDAGTGNRPGINSEQGNNLFQRLADWANAPKFTNTRGGRLAKWLAFHGQIQ